MAIRLLGCGLVTVDFINVGVKKNRLVKMKYLLSFVAVLIGLVFPLSGCSTAPVAGSKSQIIITSILVTPEVIAPGGYFISSIEAFDTDGNEILYSCASYEGIALKDNKVKLIQAPTAIGTQELVFSLSTGRSDLYITKKIYVDASLQATLKTGTTTLPLDKSFDFFSGVTKEAYYGQMEYGSYYGLQFRGDGKGNVMPYNYFLGGIVNLTYMNNTHELRDVIAPYNGYYRKYAQDSVYADPEGKLNVNEVYCVWILKEGVTHFAKIKILEISKNAVKFDWVLQGDPSKDRFYD